jgi:hypothetical protein
LNTIVLNIGYGSTPIAANDLPIGLRWVPKDQGTMIKIFAYGGMMVCEFILFVLFKLHFRVYRPVTGQM